MKQTRKATCLLRSRKSMLLAKAMQPVLFSLILVLIDVAFITSKEMVQ